MPHPHVVNSVWGRSYRDLHHAARPGKCVRVPLGVLRYCQDTVNSGMCFDDHRSIFLLIDELQRGIKTPDSLGPLPIFPDRYGRVWCLATRRLMAIQAWAAWHQDRPLEILCVIKDRINVWSSWRTLGLSIWKFGSSVSPTLHMEEPLWEWEVCDMV